MCLWRGKKERRRRRRRKKKQAADVSLVEQQYNRPDFCESTSSGEQVQAHSPFPITANCSL